MDTIDILPIGPASSGKTALICQIMEAMERVLSSSPSMSARIADNSAPRVEAVTNALKNARGHLADPLYPATTGREDLELHLGGRARSLLGRLTGGRFALNLAFHDYPGSWIGDFTSFSDRLPLAQSEIILVPVDATLLMEAKSDAEIVAGQSLHELMAVEELLVEWNKGRARTTGGGLVVVVPMRGERFFDDNGMKPVACPDGAKACDSLADLVRNRHLANVLTVLTYFGDSINVLYAPVDTLGDVSLASAVWDTKTPSFRAEFDLGPERRPLGAEIVALFILEYAVRLARRKSGGKILEEMENSLDGIAEEFKKTSGYNRALRL